tara:strand:- start:1125 stop:1493 length:369 start_codon:yes stop_codon:yes gene_type:complete
MGNCLLHYGLKDFWKEECEHCGMDHLKEVEIPPYRPIKVRIQCDDCIDAERGLCRIRDLISDTQRTMDLLNEKQNEKREQCQRIIQSAREKRSIILNNAKNFFKGTANKDNQQQEYPRPYKD